MGLILSSDRMGDKCRNFSGRGRQGMVAVIALRCYAPRPFYNALFNDAVRGTGGRPRVTLDIRIKSLKN